MCCPNVVCIGVAPDLGSPENLSIAWVCIASRKSWICCLYIITVMASEKEIENVDILHFL